MRAGILLTVLVLLSGPAGAAWIVHGDREPSTTADEVDGYMWDDPAQTPENRAYFDVVAEVATTGQNPNEALLGARVPAPFPSYAGYLGVWRDCNRDGYIGMAQGAIFEYMASETSALGQPVDESLCPFRSEFNVGDGFIAEFLWIGPKSWTAMPDDIIYQIPHMIDAPEARVWGDQGPPGAPMDRSCALSPLPRGTTSSTGVALRYLDCLDGQQVAPLAPDVRAPVSLFGDEGRVGLLQKGTGRPSATLWDCSQPRGNAVHDPQGPRAADASDPEPPVTGDYLLAGSIGPEGLAQFTLFERQPDGSAPRFHRDLTDAHGDYAYAPALSPSSVDSGGSLEDAAIAAEYGLVEHCDPQAWPGRAAELGPGSILAQLPQPESDVHGNDPALGRRQNDFAFDFQHFTVSYQEGGTLPQGAIGAPAIADWLGHGMPQDGGVMAARDVNGNGPGWHATSQSLTGTHMMTRADREPLSAHTVTFYASLGGAPFAASPHVGSGVYGTEACQGVIGANAGIRGGWDCDPADWWNPLAGSSMRPTNRYSGAPLGARVGALYELRDVD